ncbi:hypothetical protein CVT26_012758 [Gymnopilus dilepis]|uniref:DUF6534 domain-containing protein n=1 Tax=Gymnopilus dilepis TaxID=231916 RepID=A0A409WVD0_9AGAR|nr:hypothetical protein CVT26_012758 [Gymnopilus dilepis]
MKFTAVKVEVIFNGVIALLVQGFMAILSNRAIFLSMIMLLLVFGEFGVISTELTLSLRTSTPSHYVYNSDIRDSLPMTTYEELAKLKSLSIIVNALAAAGDIVIAFSLCKLLHTSRTGMHRSNRMINRLILFTINTGLLTSFCALASLVSIIAAGDTYLYIAFFFCIGRLYTNTLLVTLNSRKMIRSPSTTTIHPSGEDVFSLQLSRQSRRAANTTGISMDWKDDLPENFAEDSELEEQKTSSV